MRESEETPFTPVSDGVQVSIKVTPKASRPGITGLARDAGGRAILAVAVSAPPADGKANAAMIALLAKQWRLAKSTLSLVSGTSSRHKIVHIAGDPGRLLLDLGAWLDDIR